MLIDFGISLPFYGSKNRVLDEMSREKLTGLTKEYTPPEISNNEREMIFQKVDAYGLRIIFMKLL